MVLTENWLGEFQVARWLDFCDEPDITFLYIYIVACQPHPALVKVGPVLAPFF